MLARFLLLCVKSFPLYWRHLSTPFGHTSVRVLLSATWFEVSEVVDQMEESAFCFVPQMLVDYLNKRDQKEAKFLEPTSFFIYGVCLLVDISGFTKLSGDFCSRGKEGIDELQVATNGFIQKLVEIVYSFGGDIIKFAGDAIICVFSADTLVATKRKSTCGFEALDVKMLETNTSMSHFSPEISINTPSSVSAEVVLRVMHCAHVLRAEKAEKLTVHVAMSCGEMCFGILGGVENRWECLISGACIYELSSCLDDAPSKEAVMTHDCALKLFERMSPNSSHIKNFKPLVEQSTPVFGNHGAYQFCINELASGNFKITHVQCAEVAAVESQGKVQQRRRCGAVRTIGTMSVKPPLRQVKLFTPVPIADELEKGHALHSLAEIREVTTMFMKWDSYNADGEHRDLLELQSYFYQAQRVLHCTGAYLRQFLVDDKGCVLIGCWGMPHLSYLDNAHRALSTAAQIKYELNKLEMACSFGITTGDVYCGPVGSALRMEYAAIGSVVNMAARLMGKANGGILIDEPTYARLPIDVRQLLDPLPPIKLKGREEPLAVYGYSHAAEACTMQIKNESVEDHEISAVCKSVFNDVLQRLVAAKGTTPSPRLCVKPVTQTSEVPSSWTAWFTGVRYTKHSSPAPTTSLATVEKSMPVVVVQGREGSGRTSVLSWLHTQAIAQAIPVCYVKLGKRTPHADFGLWRLVLKQVMPREFYDNVAQQRNHALLLVGRAMPGVSKQERTTALEVMQAVLGLNCDVSGVITPVSKAESTRQRRKSSFSVRAERGAVYVATSLKTRSTKAVHARSLSIAETLFKIFSHLLQETATLLIIGSIEKADDWSMHLLQMLSQVPCQSAIVCSAGLPGPERSSNTLSDAHCDWEKHKATLQKQAGTTVITLENYTPDEIDQMLCAVLKIDTVPPEISQLVQDFSGGSYFWVREILQFIKEHGPELLMSAVGEGPDEEIPFLRTKSGAVLKGAPSSRNLQAPPAPPHMRSLSRGKSGILRQPSMRELPVNTHQKHLDKLVLCRFEGLTSEMQRILRTASIIGVTFSAEVLSAILPWYLQNQLSTCLGNLLHHKWLYQDTDNEYLYQFAHPHSHQIIYELTPSSERANQHRLIAEYIEEINGEDDEAQYVTLCFHYQHCDTDKALQYCVKATTTLLIHADAIFDFIDCLDLLQSMAPHCHSITEIAVLLDLAKQLQSSIASCEVTEDAPSVLSSIRSVFAHVKNFVFRPKRTTSRSSTSRSSSNVYNGGGTSAVVPVASSTPQHSPVARQGQLGKKPVPADVTATTTESVEQRAQSMLLEKTYQLVESLNDKYAHQMGLNLAEEWQSNRAVTDCDK